MAKNDLTNVQFVLDGKLAHVKYMRHVPEVGDEIQFTHDGPYHRVHGRRWRFLKDESEYAMLDVTVPLEDDPFA